MEYEGFPTIPALDSSTEGEGMARSLSLVDLVAIEGRAIHVADVDTATWTGEGRGGARPWHTTPEQSRDRPRSQRASTSSELPLSSPSITTAPSSTSRSPVMSAQAELSCSLPSPDEVCEGGGWGEWTVTGGRTALESFSCSASCAFAVGIDVESISSITMWMLSSSTD